MGEGRRGKGEGGRGGSEGRSREELTREAKSSADLVREWNGADDVALDTEAGENGAEYTLTFAVEAARLDRGEDA